MGYAIPAPLPWNAIVGPLAAAEDALARLDERLATSPIRDGWVERTHFADACAGLWLQGELVHLEDLVLHDAERDIRAPTQTLTRAHAALRARRRVAAAEPSWTTCPAGLLALGGTGPEGDDGWTLPPARSVEPATEPERVGSEDDAFAAELAAMDAALDRSRQVLADAASARRRDRPSDERPRDEAGPLEEWRALVARTGLLPPLLAAAVALDAWDDLAPLPRRGWLGTLLAAGLLRQRGKARHHLPCLDLALRLVPRERRHARDAAARWAAFLGGVKLGAEQGLKDHDRWLLARTLLSRKLAGRRSNSKLPALVDLVLAKPLVSAGMVAEELGVTARAAQDMVAELGLREMTGRGRYRAWGVI